MQKKIILTLTPETFVRATQGDSVFFRIPRDKLRPSGLKRLLRLEKYNRYKVSLLAESKRQRFTIPPCGLWVTFFIPLPKTWSKKKKKQYHGTFCQSRPDIDNLCKAFMDSLVSEDKHIADIRITKRWVDYEEGWIECVVTDEPMQILIVPPAKE
jgi:Holliday junction resolvase RusA-like endonuclease